MEIQTKIFQTVSEFLGINIGQLPESGGIVMELAPSGTPKRFLNGQSYGQISVLLLSKNKSQKTALNNLDEIIAKCSTLNLPNGNNWEIKTIDVATMPNYVTCEKNDKEKLWIYSMILTVNYYNKEMLK